MTQFLRVKTPRGVTLGLIALSFGLTGCKDSTSPPEPASVTAEATVVAEGTAGLLLTTAPTFVVKDADGNALGGVSLTVTVTAGGGILTDAPTSSKSGGTPIGTWKLGNTAGLNSVTVTVAGLPPLVISVNGKAGPPVSLVFVSGSGQVALAGTVLPARPVAQLRDQFGNGVAGVAISFFVTSGNGTVSATPVTTDASGNATSPEWALGKSVEVQELRAFSLGLAATVVALVQSDYNIDVRFFGPAMPSLAQDAFVAAAARIRGSIVGDVPNTAAPTTPLNIDAGCGTSGVTAFAEAVDDVIIYAAVAPIDGPGRVLAFAGPCFIRGPSTSTNRQTVIGVMKFDSDDLQTLITRGTLTDVIQHEMLHVVGFGTLWNTYSVIAGAGTVESRFIGTLGVGGCVTIGGASVCPGSVPVENVGGPGTADGHWRESVFQTELMTGFVTNPAPGFTGIVNPLSLITVQSLGDLGYVVNGAGADPYVIPGTSALRAFNQMSADMTPGWEQNVKPKFELSRTGQVSAIRLQ